MKGVKPITGKLSPTQSAVLAKYAGRTLSYVSKAPIYAPELRYTPAREHKTLLGLILGGRMRVLRVPGPQPSGEPPGSEWHTSHYRLEPAG